MYSAGNVKNVKDECRCVWQRIADFFQSNQHRFIFMLTDGKSAHIAEVNCDKSSNELAVSAVKYEQRRGSDDLFYQEILYCFCRDRNITSLPLYICLDERLLERRVLEFPKLKRSEIQKALAWELGEYESKAYGWHCLEQDDICSIEAVLCDKTFVSQLQEAAAEVNLKLLGIFGLSEQDCTADAVDLKLLDEELKELVPDFDRLGRAICAYGDGIYICRKEMAHCCWRRIYLAAGIVMLAFSLLSTCLVYSDYSEARQQTDILRQRNELLSAERAQVEWLLHKSAELQNKQGQLKQMMQKTQPLYPFTVSMAAKMPNDVKLTAISADGGSINLSGKASDYPALGKFRQMILTDALIDGITAEKASWNDADGEVDFRFELAADKGRHRSTSNE